MGGAIQSEEIKWQKEEEEKNYKEGRASAFFPTSLLLRCLVFLSIPAALILALNKGRRREGLSHAWTWTGQVAADTAGSALENDQIISRQSIIHFAAGRGPEGLCKGVLCCCCCCCCCFWRVPGWKQVGL